MNSAVRRGPSGGRRHHVLLAVDERLVELTVQPDCAPLFVQLQDGRIQNAYTLKILNKNRDTESSSLAARGVSGAELKVVGHDGETEPVLDVASDSVGSFRVFVRAIADSYLPCPSPIELAVKDVSAGETSVYRTTFNRPGG